MFFHKKEEQLYPIGQEIPLKENDSYRFLDSITVHALKTGKFRMMMLAYGFVFLFTILGIRLFEQCIIRQNTHPFKHASMPLDYPISRADITDRNGVIVATSLPIVDLYVDARQISDPDKIADDLIQIFPSMDRADLLEKLHSKAAFKYLRRNLTPQEQFQVNNLGYPQLNFINSERRVYPQSNLLSHLIGFTDIDNQGIAGLEKQYETLLTSDTKITLSVDVRLQTIMHAILTEAVAKFQADGAVGIIMDAQNAEVLALISLPDFDLNKMPIDANKIPLNKASLGMYELGSVMKPFTVAFGLESGLIITTSQVDAHNPYKLARGRTITDFQAENRVLSVPEVLIYSSNIGTAKIAQMLGSERQKEFLGRFHFLSQLPLALPEKGKPIVQKKWDDVETATIGYGYGLAVSPLHLTAAFAALINGGLYHTPTFIKGGNDNQLSEQVLSAKTSNRMRHLLRGVIEIGSGKSANIKGFQVIGKTGTAQIQNPQTGKYIEGKVRTSFVSAFPMDNPKYIVYVMIENPVKRKEDWYFNTAGWNACPTGGKIIETLAPVLRVEPQEDKPLPSYMEQAYEYKKNKKKR